ncbi:MAG: right-handed parallel beta-helix repeat-containing protein [Chloroflexi bacterium]|nr:right-handed parallel beta-helix repeat-containing protein [Chloroflexota bacterium]
MQYGNTISSSSVHHNGLTGIELHDSSDNSLQSVEVHNNGASGVSVNHETGLTILGSDILANGLDGVFDTIAISSMNDFGSRRYQHRGRRRHNLRQHWRRHSCGRLPDEPGHHQQYHRQQWRGRNSPAGWVGSGGWQQHDHRWQSVRWQWRRRRARVR